MGRNDGLAGSGSDGSSAGGASDSEGRGSWDNGAECLDNGRRDGKTGASDNNTGREDGSLGLGEWPVSDGDGLAGASSDGSCAAGAGNGEGCGDRADCGVLGDNLGGGACEWEGAWDTADGPRAGAVGHCDNLGLVNLSVCDAIAEGRGRQKLTWVAVMVDVPSVKVVAYGQVVVYDGTINVVVVTPAVPAGIE